MVEQVSGTSNDGGHDAERDMSAAAMRRRADRVNQVSDPSRGVYGISVAAELTGLGAQTLRLYETRGLLQPDRTAGGTRRYSPDDLDRLRRIGDLLDAGLNLAGIDMVFALEHRNRDLEQRNRALRARNWQLCQEGDARPPTGPTRPDPAAAQGGHRARPHPTAGPGEPGPVHQTGDQR